MPEIGAIDDAETYFFAVVARAEAGREIVIGRAGKPAVRLAVEASPQQRRLGETKGLVKIGPHFGGLPEDFMVHFR